MVSYPSDRTLGMSTVSASERFHAVVRHEIAGDGSTPQHNLDLLCVAPAPEIAAGIAAVLDGEVARAWERGWQPADLARCIDHGLGKVDSAVIRGAIASESESYAALGERVAPEWMAQLDRIDARRDTPSQLAYLAHVRAEWRDVVLAAVRLTHWLRLLPKLPRLVDPPAEWRAGMTVSEHSLPRGILHKVRALLAKAESTTFEAESEAFTAKAQELMARHRIDRAVLGASGREAGEVPVGRRIGIDSPYSNAKAVLLCSVAQANGCDAVWSKSLGFATVFGYAGELDAVEELFTSLLVQATAALQREGSKYDHRGQSRTAQFRRSFLVAFAYRIGLRLRTTVDETVEAATAETGTALVPLLAARTERAVAARREAFPRTRGLSTRASDGEGWAAGTAFGDRADLSMAPKLTRRVA
jgi:Protein of unknown function (DUF2786)